jgi:glycosyltransferase involved in cell wall biosynthesis
LIPVAPRLSVILPTRNPHPGRLHRTLAGLAAQTLDRTKWEVLLIDNASDQPWELSEELVAALPEFQRLPEAVIGLTPARLRGINAARGDVLVFVDDDNVLAPDYLAQSLRLFAEQPRLAAAGGPVRPEWETPPPDWTGEFHGLLALRDLGAEIKICPGGSGVRWPDFAPVGAGLVVRRAGTLAYADALNRDPARRALDRRGRNLGSGGDNDLVFALLHAGGDVGYFPELQLTHLIPASRLEASYLARLNEGIMRTWVAVLHLHGQCPWPAIASWTVPLRTARAWWRFQAWRSPAHRIRWRGAAGQFQGQAGLLRLNASGQ